MSTRVRPVPRTSVRSIVEALRSRPSLPGEPVQSESPTSTLDDVRGLVERAAPFLPAEHHSAVVRRVLAEISGFGVLEQYLDDPAVTEVAVNRGREVWVDRNGGMELVDDLGETGVEPIIERIISPLGLRFDLSSPVVDARLPGGHRMCAVRSPLAVDGTSLSIRRFAVRSLDLSEHSGPDVCALLDNIMARRLNLVVCGAASSGKTTLLNALAARIAPTERVITVEDTAELVLPCPNLVRLETRPATPDGVAEVSIRRLVQTALRLRPDRIVIGEVRGAEAFDMVQALNTGHDGSLSTIHANSPSDALRRLTTLAMLGAPASAGSLLTEQVNTCIDIVVQTARHHDGRRSIASICETQPDGSLRTLATGQRVDAEPLRRRLHLVGAGLPTDQ